MNRAARPGGAFWAIHIASAAMAAALAHWLLPPAAEITRVSVVNAAMLAAGGVLLTASNALVRGVSDDLSKEVDRARELDSTRHEAFFQLLVRRHAQLWTGWFIATVGSAIVAALGAGLGIAIFSGNAAATATIQRIVLVVGYGLLGAAFPAVIRMLNILRSFQLFRRRVTELLREQQLRATNLEQLRRRADNVPFTGTRTGAVLQ